MAEISENQGECEPRKEKTSEETDGSILVLQSQEFELPSQEEFYGVKAVSETMSVMSRHTKRKTEGKDEQCQKKQRLMSNQPITFKLDINVDDTKNPTSVIGIELEGPLDQQKLQLEASMRRPPQLFLVKFPKLSDDFAYLDTKLQTLSFRGLPSDTKLSILMKIVNVGSPRTPKYRWSTKVIPDYYLTVTRSDIPGARRARRVKFNKYRTEIATAPTWQVQADPTDQFLLSFSKRAENSTWYLTPEEHGTDKQVVAVTDQQYAMNVYHVTNYDDETLPSAIIVPRQHD